MIGRSITKVCQKVIVTLMTTKNLQYTSQALHISIGKSNGFICKCKVGHHHTSIDSNLLYHLTDTAMTLAMEYHKHNHALSYKQCGSPLRQGLDEIQASFLQAPN